MKDAEAEFGLTEDRVVAACLQFQSADIPDSAISAARAAILDWLGCAIGASGSDLAGAMAAHLAHDGSGTGAATVLLPGLPAASARDAALVNGAVSHVLELDDIYTPALYHPGVCVIPAALAAGQSAGASGDRLLRAVLAGYEVSNRLGAAINPQHYRFWHTTGTVGTIGAAVAAAVALGLSKERVAWALGNAASMAAGLKQAFASEGMTKPLHAGRAAEGGVAAGLMARAGVSGATGMISGAAGLAAAMGEGAETADAMGDLFEDWTIMRPTLKRFASCGHTFAAADGALALCAEQGIAASDVARVEVQTYSAAIAAAGLTAPSTAFEARFSIAFCTAAAISGRDLSDPSMFDEAVTDRDIQALAARVDVMPGATFDARFPTLRGATVRMACHDGRAVEIDIPTRKGAPENPLEPAEIWAKAARLITRGGADSAAWTAWCAGLPEAPGIGRDTMPAIGGTT
jgi:2-methylcitrate dehydratase PrpD